MNTHLYFPAFLLLCSSSALSPKPKILAEQIKYSEQRIRSMVSLSPLYYFFAISLFFVARVLLFRKTKRGTSSKIPNLPPGPPGWPVVGNLLQIVTSGKPFMHVVADLRQVYGPIFTLKLGTRTLIIISSAELAYEALIQKGQVFANRPRETPTRRIFSSEKFTINSAVYGPVWRSLRRNMVSGMLNNTRIKGFSGIRKSALDRFIDRLRNEAGANDGLVWVLKNARFAVFCILLAMCFGEEMEEELVVRIEEVMKKILIAIDPRIDDYLPILSPLFSKQTKRVLEVRAEQVATLTPLIEKRRSALKKSPRKSETSGYLDTLFDLEIEGRKESPNNDELVTLCSEFLNGGTDTTATGLEWAIAQLIRAPRIQTRLYNEIRETAGDRIVEEKDVEKMEYLNAVVKELLRKHPPTYFLLTHAVTETTTLAGYDIPTGVNVDFYTPAISEDPRLWSDPAEFKPERFMTGEGDEVADITGVTEVKMMPFGAGRRICPGLGMAMLHVNLMLARMVQAFEWLPDPSDPQVDMTAKYEFTVTMKKPLRALVKPRN